MCVCVWLRHDICISSAVYILTLVTGGKEYTEREPYSVGIILARFESCILFG